MFRLPKIRNRERSRGQSVVEFALILPVLVFLLLVTLDAGRLFMSYITLTNATRVAANFGATIPGAFTGTPDTTTYDAVVNRETAGLNCKLRAAGGYTPPIPTYPNGTGLSGISVASMTCDFSMLTPFITAFFGNAPLPITASAEFPIRTGAIANIGGTTTLPPPGSPQAGFDFIDSSGTLDGFGNESGVGPVTVNVKSTSLNAQTWDWNWGDLSLDEFVSAPATHTYAAPGVYTVTLTVTNTVGTSSRSRVVTVTAAAPLPVAAFYGTPVANPPQYTAGGGSSGAAIVGSLPLNVNFTNVSTNGATNYSWDFGDSGSSTASGPQHQYTALGVFSVTLTVTAPTGGTPTTRTAYVTTGCVVPNFANTLTSAAQATWANAGFSGTITYDPNGNGTSSTTPPSPAKNIEKQTLNGGDFVPATRLNSGSPWKCAPDITLGYHT